MSSRQNFGALGALKFRPLFRPYVLSPVGQRHYANVTRVPLPSRVRSGCGQMKPVQPSDKPFLGVPEDKWHYSVLM